MMTLEHLIAHFERRYRECLKEFERSNEQDSQIGIDAWQEEVVIARDTLSYLKTLASLTLASAKAPASGQPS